MQQRKPIKTPHRNPHSPHLKTFPFPFPRPTLKSILISMASLFSLLLLSMLLFFSLTVASNNHNRRNSPKPSLSPPADPGSVSVPSEIRQACKATRFPDSCVSSLATAGIPSNPNPVQILQLALRISSENLDKAQTMVEEILGASSNNLNRTTAAKNCLETLGNSAYRLRSTAEAVARGRIKDGRAWLSAALLYQYDCWSGLKYANDTKMVGNTMSFLTSLIGFSSNALSMLASYDIFGNETRSWLPPRTERDGSWEGISGSGSGSDIISVPTGLKPDVTVCKDGSGGGCDFSTVQAAVDAAPGTRRFVVLIKAGVYEETVRVGLEKKFVVFLGEGTGKTVITGSSYSGQPGITTYNSATVGVMGDGFMARDLTMENTAGPDAHQAVAFRSDSDLSVIENCEFLGNQDTLYAHSLRQLYKSCHIEGNVDFIFGNSASIFQNCTILVRPRQVKPEKGENNAITAQGRTDPAQSTGFVFQDCLINGTDAYMALYNSKPSVHKNFLGRPWKEYSRTMFIKCNLEALISPAGWMPWSGDFALKTLYYGEFDNSGPGANTSARVSWSSQIPAEHVDAYSAQNFIQGDEWLPTTS